MNRHWGVFADFSSQCGESACANCSDKGPWALVIGKSLAETGVNNVMVN